MSSKEVILSKYRRNIKQKFDMPSLDDIKAVTYPDPLLQFTTMTESVGGHVVEVKEGQDINQMIKELYPDAKEIASNLPEITIATRNPDTIESAQALNGTDVGIIRGKFGVDGYGTFISGPSKTADIAQVLVMGAQAARSVTVLLLPE